MDILKWNYFETLHSILDKTNKQVSHFNSQSFQFGFHHIISDMSNFFNIYTYFFNNKKKEAQDNIDQENAYELGSQVIRICDKLGHPNCHLVMKTFQGDSHQRLRSDLKQRFKMVHTFKPISSRSTSKEVYLIGSGFSKSLFSEQQNIQLFTKIDEEVCKSKTELKKEITNTPLQNKQYLTKSEFLKNYQKIVE
ncbi:Ribosomal RNA large subunit methyltransferase J [Reticulomyxa filosa]|uniref:rRNA methyltransferase 2, mitochondrial n=1 Tax=Reticulomyxa filosa TaxID=46433 RepID=X6P2W0_RETFI|nr:Ribosomal RNA large subunit methyltransferase J [Reticulomyxa filosa]|eukprot:ETO32576.1 Ribosomal RNA large subunit methyltransferase J [Reticulomyxa filosa]